MALPLHQIAEDADVALQPPAGDVDARHGQTQLRHLRKYDEPPTHFGPVLTVRDAMHFIPCASLDATRKWLKSHGILPLHGHSYQREDIRREAKKRSRRGRSAGSQIALAKYRKRAS